MAKKNLTVSMNNDVGDEDTCIMYESLLDNIDVETLMDEDDFEIDMGSQDGLQGVKQEDPALRDERKLEAQERPRILGEEQVDGCSHYKQAVVTTTKEAAIFDRGHMVIDSTPVREQDYVHVSR